jgi:hypothetical protein
MLDKARTISFVSVYAVLLAPAPYMEDGPGVMRISVTIGGTASETGPSFRDWPGK